MPDDVIKQHQKYYILSTSDRLDDRTRVLKQGDTFAIFDRFGDVETFGPSELGLYHQDTRFLSRLVLQLGARRPLLLSSTVKDDNESLAVDLMNPDFPAADPHLPVPRGTVHIFRAKILWNARCYERLRIQNYGDAVVAAPLVLEFAADFTDIFEVRGLRRAGRGRPLPPEVTPEAVVLAYEGLDGRVRRTRLTFDPAPARLEADTARFDLRLEPHVEVTYRWTVECEPNGEPGPAAPPRSTAVHRYEDAVHAVGTEFARAKTAQPHILTSNEQFNDWLNRSLADLHMLRTQTAHGPYPYAGVPWFSTPFGRDGIITALETLAFHPALARGVLAYLAATQADAENAEQDAQPGKILHETRAGEMAALGEVPFGRYYGSVDATPLFVLLAGAYYERTGDRAFVEGIWPNVERALAWLRDYGDADGDGFVEYTRRSRRGLVHQGWKDSDDAVFHEDGSPAEPPIALCEVQGYVYAAKRAAATLAEALDRLDRARALAAEAESLRERFENAFWCEDLDTYALALDGQKMPCRVRASNAGHCLFAEIASVARAARVAATLTGDAAFSGWGVRTLAATEPGYNPMSYHNGSVWPHDNALIAAGFARYGLKDEAVQILTGLFDASLFFDLHRQPELFCGFPRRPGESPTLYPVSCAPQAWASGAVFLILQACLGLDVRGAVGEVVFTNPLLPPFLQEVRIHDLRVGDARVDLTLTRHERDVGVNVARRTGPVRVVVVK